MLQGHFVTGLGLLAARDSIYELRKLDCHEGSVAVPGYLVLGEALAINGRSVFSDVRGSGEKRWIQLLSPPDHFNNDST